MKLPLAASGLALGLCAALPAMAGNPVPVDNTQPSLVMTQAFNPTGIFPSQGGAGTPGDTLGFVYTFAGNFAPGSTFASQGQTVSIAQNIATFAVIGTQFGGNGTTNFALPDLSGTAVVGGTPGMQSGSGTIVLAANQIPHGAVTQPFNNAQPSLALTPLIAASGIYPSQGGAGGTASFIGQLAYFAGNFAPGGWLPADGRLLPIATNIALFSILGTQYGGNGTTNFALPNLIGSVAVGADVAHPLGTSFGANATALTTANLPVGVTPGAPVNNDQSSLALNYIIATSGLFPSRNGGAGFDQTAPTIGEVALFAGDFAPSGWAFADGQALSISQNIALFSILGTQYGGNGVTTFDLPDLQGRTVVGSGSNYSVGTAFGSDSFQLTAANVPPAAVPEPASWLAMLAGFAGLGGALRRARARAASCPRRAIL